MLRWKNFMAPTLVGVMFAASSAFVAAPASAGPATSANKGSVRYQIVKVSSTKRDRIVKTAGLPGPMKCLQVGIFTKKGKPVSKKWALVRPSGPDKEGCAGSGGAYLLTHPEDGVWAKGPAFDSTAYISATDFCSAVGDFVMTHVPDGQDGEAQLMTIECNRWFRSHQW